MTNLPGYEKCSCAGAGTNSAQPQSTEERFAKIVKAQVPQGQEAKFNVRIVPGRSLAAGLTHRVQYCKPRGDRPSWTAGAAGLSAELVATLAKADKPMMAWLAKDAANAQRFLANPVAAMQEAGIELARAAQKALARASLAAEATRAVSPGVNVAALTAKAFPDGRVGGLGSGKPGAGADDFGCAPKKKG
jgi:hypothetical protein